MYTTCLLVSRFRVVDPPANEIRLFATAPAAPGLDGSTSGAKALEPVSKHHRRRVSACTAWEACGNSVRLSRLRCRGASPLQILKLLLGAFVGRRECWFGVPDPARRRTVAAGFEILSNQRQRQQRKAAQGD